MAFDLWTHQFCLACDKQVQTDGAAYCSEACRLADHEWTSTPSSQATSPAVTSPCDSFPWSASDLDSKQPRAGTRLSLPAPMDSPSRLGLYLGESVSNLTPSSSHSSLCSMQSSASSEATQLSDKSRQELRAYAISFEHVRIRRRRSY